MLLLLFVCICVIVVWWCCLGIVDVVLGSNIFWLPDSILIFLGSDIGDGVPPSCWVLGSSVPQSWWLVQAFATSATTTSAVQTSAAAGASKSTSSSPPLRPAHRHHYHYAHHHDHHDDDHQFRGRPSPPVRQGRVVPQQPARPFTNSVTRW